MDKKENPQDNNVTKIENNNDVSQKQSSRSFVKSKRGATALLVTVAALAAALGISAWTGAWQIFNRKSQSEMVTISDSTKLSLGGCTFYYGDMSDLDSNGNPRGHLITDATADTFEGMNDYDAVIGRNDDTAIYIRMTITGEEVEAKNPIKITVNRENKDTAGFNTDEVGLEYTDSNSGESGHVARYLSNIVSMRFMQIDSVATASEADTVYQACKNESEWSKEFDYSAAQPKFSFFSDIPVAEGSATKRATDLAKYNSFTATINDYRISETEDGARAAIIFMKLDYEQPLLEIYLNENHPSLSGRLNQSATENFVGDISKIEIEVESTQN